LPPTLFSKDASTDGITIQITVTVLTGQGSGISGNVFLFAQGLCSPISKNLI
jgi:hypothetical protein